MNWFERYGIPGAYFIGLFACWIYVFDPTLLTAKNHEWLFALAALIFLPIGYIISVFSQFLYLIWRRLFYRYRTFRGCFGFHGAAIDRVGVPNPGFPIDDEAVIEAQTLLLSASCHDLVDTHIYMRDWISRRMDVIAIDESLFWSTVFVTIMSAIKFQWYYNWSQALVPLVMSAIIVVFMICSFIVLRRQIIEVISGIYRRYQTGVNKTVA